MGVGSKSFDVDTAKSKNPREIEAIILKNRNGRTGDKIGYKFYAMFNYFEELQGLPNISSSKSAFDDDDEILLLSVQKNAHSRKRLSKALYGVFRARGYNYTPKPLNARQR